MTKRRSPSVLRLALGLPEPEASTSVPALRPAENVSRAFAPSAEPILGAPRAGGGSQKSARVWSVPFAVMEMVSLERNENAPEQVRIRFLDAAAGTPSVEGIQPFLEDATGFEIDSEDPVVTLDFRADEAFFVDWNGRRHLVSAEDDSGSPAIHVATFDLFALSSAVRCAVPAFVAEWLIAPPSEDVWLASHVRELSIDGRASGVVAAVGAWTRLRSRTAAQRADLVAKSLRGEVDEDSVAPNRWARAFLVGAQLDSVVRSAIGSCGRLAEELGAIDAADPSEAPTWARFAEALRDRDDLESTRVMLHAAESAGELERCTVDVDAAGDDLVHSLPIEPSLANDEHIARVALKMPDLWWGKPARVN
jgi:hypothetical protein